MFVVSSASLQRTWRILLSVFASPILSRDIPKPKKILYVYELLPIEIHVRYCGSS